MGAHLAGFSFVWIPMLSPRQLIAQTDKDFQAAEVDQRRGVEDDAEYGVDGGKEPQKEKGEPS